MKRKFLHIAAYFLLFSMAFLFLHSELGFHHDEEEEFHNHHDYCLLVHTAHPGHTVNLTSIEKKLQNDISLLPLPESEDAELFLSVHNPRLLLTGLTRKQSPPVFILNRTLLI